MALRRKNTSDLDSLRAKRDDLAQRLKDAERVAAGADPVDAWEVVSKATSDVLALEKALQTLDARIAATEHEFERARIAAQDAVQSERKASAMIALETTARRVCDMARDFDAGLLAELDKAARELGAIGGAPSPAVSPALQIGAAVGAALDAWRYLSPGWVGLPEPISRQAQALADLALAVAAGEARLDQYRALKRDARHGEARPDDALMENMGHGLAGAKSALLRLTEPGLTAHDRIVKSCSGIPELSGWLGEYWERYSDAQRKKEREELARQSLLLA